jgi:hypothetical protein
MALNLSKLFGRGQANVQIPALDASSKEAGIVADSGAAHDGLGDQGVGHVKWEGPDYDATNNAFGPVEPPRANAVEYGLITAAMDSQSPDDGGAGARTMGPGHEASDFTIQISPDVHSLDSVDHPLADGLKTEWITSEMAKTEGWAAIGAEANLTSGDEAGETARTFGQGVEPAESGSDGRGAEALISEVTFPKDSYTATDDLWQFRDTNQDGGAGARTMAPGHEASDFTIKISPDYVGETALGGPDTAERMAPHPGSSGWYVPDMDSDSSGMARADSNTVSPYNEGDTATHEQSAYFNPKEIGVDEIGFPAGNNERSAGGPLQAGHPDADNFTIKYSPGEAVAGQPQANDEAGTLKFGMEHAPTPDQPLGFDRGYLGPEAAVDPSGGEVAGSDWRTAGEGVHHSVVESLGVKYTMFSPEADPASPPSALDAGFTISDDLRQPAAHWDGPLTEGDTGTHEVAEQFNPKEIGIDLKAGSSDAFKSVSGMDSETERSAAPGTEQHLGIVQKFEGPDEDGIVHHPAGGFMTQDGQPVSYAAPEADGLKTEWITANRDTAPGPDQHLGLIQKFEGGDVAEIVQSPADASINDRTAGPGHPEGFMMQDGQPRSHAAGIVEFQDGEDVVAGHPSGLEAANHPQGVTEDVTEIILNATGNGDPNPEGTGAHERIVQYNSTDWDFANRDQSPDGGAETAHHEGIMMQDGQPVSHALETGSEPAGIMPFVEQQALASSGSEVSIESLERAQHHAEGFYALPEKGDEVLVGFSELESDADAPSTLVDLHSQTPDADGGLVTHQVDIPHMPADAGHHDLDAGHDHAQGHESILDHIHHIDL